MAYLSAVGLERFRTFRREAMFELAPLTIITGPNSSGKSSLFKALLLLQDNFNRMQLGSLRFSGAEHRTTSFNSILSSGAKPPVVFKVGLNRVLFPRLPIQLTTMERPAMEWDPPGRVFFEFHFGINHINKMVITAGDEDGHVAPLFVVEVEDSSDGSQPRHQFTVRVNYPYFYRRLGDEMGKVAESLRIEIDNEDVLSFLEMLQRPGKYGWVTSKRRSSFGSFLNDVLNCVWGEIQGNTTELENDSFSNTYFNAFRRDTVTGVLEMCIKALREQLGSLGRIAQTRGPARRVYQVDDSEDRLYYLVDQFLGEKQSRSASGSLRNWIRTFGIGDNVIVERIPDVGITVAIQRGGEEIPLADVGYGHYSLLPLIFHTRQRRDPQEWSAQRESTLLVEEPETNLHPNLQSKLADLFIDLIGDIDGLHSTGKLNVKKMIMQGDRPRFLRKRLIVETHSEYLIRRLQYLVASGKADRERIVIYYLGPDPEAEDYVRRITITESGKLSDELGPGFLDEATNLMIDLYKYGSQN